MLQIKLIFVELFSFIKMDLSNLITNLEEITTQLKNLNRYLVPKKSKLEEKREQTIKKMKEEYPIPDGFTVEEYWNFYKEEHGYYFMTRTIRMQMIREFEKKYRPEKHQEQLERDRKNRLNKKNST